MLGDILLTLDNAIEFNPDTDKVFFQNDTAIFGISISYFALVLSMLILRSLLLCLWATVQVHELAVAMREILFQRCSRSKLLSSALREVLGGH